jgi:hypothetical protein
MTFRPQERETTMRYALLIHSDEGNLQAPAPGELTKMSADYAAFTEAMKKAGVYLGGDRLQPANTGAAVQTRDGQTTVLDGPYADTKEQFGGYYLIDVPNMDAAVQWATRCPAAARGTVEVRAIWELAGTAK